MSTLTLATGARAESISIALLLATVKRDVVVKATATSATFTSGVLTPDTVAPAVVLVNAAAPAKVVTTIASGVRSPTDDVLRSAWEQTGSLRHADVRRQARSVLVRLRAALVARDLAGCPPLTLLESEDQSAAVEWRFPDRRLAFTLEPNAEESGWHFVSLPSSGGALEHGSMDDLNLSLLLNRFLLRR